MADILTDESGKKLFLLGNEAIVRGSLEAGLDFASTYPGTPSSEIGNTFFKINKEANLYFEFSTNEKVAMEVAAAASASNLRAMTFMKHVGLNVASDAFMTVAYQGVRGGFVMVTADDPGCHSSQNEQDNRYYARIANIPMLEPASAQEAKEMTRIGFDLSEELELPVLLRTTTRLNHVRGIVHTSEKKPQRGRGHFEKDPGRFVTIPAHARMGHKLLLERMARAKTISEASPFNEIIEMGGSEYGIITSGVGFNYAADVMKEAGIKGRILKLGMTWPLPTDMITKFMGSVDNIIMVEEGEPLLENEILALAKDAKPGIKVFGKRTGHFSVMGEYSPDMIKAAFSQITGLDLAPGSITAPTTELPVRPPSLCPGCPHRSTYYAVKKALKQNFKDAIFSTDIGCYTLGIQDPLNVADFLLCMGSSVDAAGGFSKATDQPVFAFLGDSTFFHSGIPGLVNAVYNRHKFVYTILDNRTTAMTGHQEHPGSGRTLMGEKTRAASIAGIGKALGIKRVAEVNPYDLRETERVIREELEAGEPSLIVSVAPCPLKEKLVLGPPRVIRADLCKNCRQCLKLGCPAIEGEGEGPPSINPLLCNGCAI